MDFNSMLSKTLHPNPEGMTFRVNQTLSSSGAIKAGVSFVELNNSTTIIAATIAAPTKGQFLVITQKDTGTAGHTVTLGSGTFDGSSTVATFNAANETLVLFGVDTDRYVVVENIGSVALA